MTPSSSIAAIAFASILAATASAPASPAIDRDDTAGPDTATAAVLLPPPRPHRLRAGEDEGGLPRGVEVGELGDVRLPDAQRPIPVSVAYVCDVSEMLGRHRFGSVWFGLV